MVGIPSEAGFYRNRYFNCLDYGFGYLQHLGDILEHSRACAFSCYLFDRTTEVDVEYIGFGFFYDFGSSHHRFRILTVYLYGNGTFFFIDSQLLGGLIDRTNQCVTGYKFGIYHVCSELFAHQAESRIGYIFHRSQKNRAFP